MDEFSAIFQEATAQIATEYFRLPVVGSAVIYRERVYCYELYHQMRLRWPNECTYRLNGEIDKRMHPYFANDRWAPKPDFLIHIPGADDNYAAIEVKTVDNLRVDEIRKDFNTLFRFKTEAGYQRGIQLVFGATAATIINVSRRAGLDLEAYGDIELWGHAAAGLPAERVVM